MGKLPSVVDQPSSWLMPGKAERVAGCGQLHAEVHRQQGRVMRRVPSIGSKLFGRCKRGLERTLLRAFHRDLGQPPAVFVEASGVDCAGALLDSFDWPLARVAQSRGQGCVA